MYTNEQVSLLVKNCMKEFEVHINTIESETKKESPNLSTISCAAGKLSKLYVIVCNLTGVFSGNDFRVGGYKDSKYLTMEDEKLHDDDNNTTKAAPKKNK